MAVSSYQYVVWFPLSSSLSSTKKKWKLEAASGSTEEIRVCTNRSCRRQGSVQTLQVIKDISPPNISVNSCGCLGRCGAGPNVVRLPQGIIVGHCSTATSAARVTVGQDDAAIRKALDALALRNKAQAEIDQGNFYQAELLLSQAINHKPFSGLHTTYKCRSLVRLAMGNYTGALEDAQEALNLSPQYLEAYMCEGDAFMEMEQYDAAEKSYSMCLQIDPTVRRSKSFKTRVSKLQERLIAASMSHNQQ
ncbi:hypothetical protein JCGZ_17402 [Jatropha curcas]|uniref:Uncharacterized protein n=1 Tax=Jatropha curcas TaxID=180498 RepID=A0A067LLZ3_JATCU|nr:small glutamine-rich tetratricopeptide repeat-containing protein alpha [Jatropha curcas]KDP45795.1 hypothetical protein JCGZ_17402 [Jatropha curcas]